MSSSESVTVDLECCVGNNLSLKLAAILSRLEYFWLLLPLSERQI
jgi:hypothetical protein